MIKTRPILLWTLLVICTASCVERQPVRDSAPNETGTTSAASSTAPPPATVTEAGVGTTLRLSQIDTRTDGTWVDGLGTDFQVIYVSLSLDGDRVPGATDRCPGIEGDTWIDERGEIDGVILFDDLGEVDTKYDLYAVYPTVNELAKPACMYIDGTYTGRSGEIASTLGDYSIEWGTVIEFNEITFDEG